MLKRLREALNAAPAAMKGALVYVFHFALLTLAAPGLLLGGAYTLTQPEPYALTALLGLVGVALVASGLALHFARKSARDPRLTPKQAALTGAIQLASVPAVPFLLGCTALRQLSSLGVLWGLALAFYLLARYQLDQWGAAACGPVTVTAASAATPPEAR